MSIFRGVTHRNGLDGESSKTAEAVILEPQDDLKGDASDDEVDDQDDIPEDRSRPERPRCAGGRPRVEGTMTGGADSDEFSKMPHQSTLRPGPLSNPFDNYCSSIFMGNTNPPSAAMWKYAKANAYTMK
eukprot:gene9014-16655_t